MARSRVEATDMVSAHLSEPDHPLLVYGNAKGKERLYTPFGCKRIVEYEAGVGIESSQGVGVEFGEPDIAMGVQRQIVRRTGQREHLARITGVRDREPGQGIDLKMSCCGEVVPDIVSVLFGEPDGIVSCDLHPHHPEAAMWWRHLLKGSCPWVKDAESVPAHFTKPDPACMVNNETHYLAVCLWEGVLTKLTCRGDGRRSG